MLLVAADFLSRSRLLVYVGNMATDHIGSSTEEMTSEVSRFETMDSTLSADVKLEEPEGYVEYIGQNMKLHLCTESFSSDSVSEQTEMMTCGIELVKEEPTSDDSYKDTSPVFNKLANTTGCSCNKDTAGDANMEFRITEIDEPLSHKNKNCNLLSDKTAAVMEGNSKSFITNEKHQLKERVEASDDTNHVFAKSGDCPTGHTGSASHITYTEDTPNTSNNAFDSAVIVDECLKKAKTGTKIYVCDVCDAIFTHSTHRKCHMRIHTQEKPHKCDDCDASFAKLSNLKRHKRKHTGERPFSCDVCGALFASSSNLKCHKRTHTGERPYSCDYCTLSFASAEHLKTHVRTHTGEKPYKCDDCNACFTSVSQLKRHKRVHTGEKPYKCDACGAAFTQLHTLKCHIRKHRGERPYKCDDCGFAFTSGSHLKRHMKVHTNKSHKCDHCDQSFFSARKLKHHLIHIKGRNL